MLALLRNYYLNDRRNGDEYAFLPHVRNKAGQDASRTLDLLTVGLWPSRGLPFIGHEIKCSRGDWLTELKTPAKADVFHGVIDAMYLVVADPKMVQLHELPPTWGLMHADTYKYRGETRERIKVAKRVDIVIDRDRVVSRTFVAALLKNATRVGEATPEEITEAVERARASWRTTQERADQARHDRLAQLEEVVRRFEEESGVSLGGSRWGNGRDAEKVGRALRLVLANSDAPKQAERQLKLVADHARRVADQADKALAAVKIDEDGGPW